ncbi:TetR/AcrR family transcriptional regulator [Gordonia sp. NPDC003424]
MAWDTEATKQRILDAATTQFAAHGPDGTTIERIAKTAGVNKERIYNYFGGKPELFARVLRDALAAVVDEVPIEFTTPESVGAFAGRLFDYHRVHPELIRLLLWEGLTYTAEVPDESLRRAGYRQTTAAFAQGQAAGVLDDAIPADVLHILLVSLAGYWAAMPQVARMITETDNESDGDRRRAGVIQAALRIGAPTTEKEKHHDR